MSPPTIGGKKPTIVSSVGIGMATFCNEFAQGYGLGVPFPTVPVDFDDGSQASYGLSALTPSGAFAKLTAVGTGVVVADVVRSWLLNWSARRRGRSAKMFGQALTNGR